MPAPCLVPASTIHGLRITTGAETLLAAARDLGVLDLVILGDSALRCGHCNLEELRATAAQRRRGAPRLRAVLALLDDRSESPWESVMRVLHVAAEINVEPQRRIYDSRGRFVARADLWLVGTRRIHEYDEMSIATVRFTAVILLVIVASSRSIVNVWVSLRPSYST